MYTHGTLTTYTYSLPEIILRFITVAIHCSKQTYCKETSKCYKKKTTQSLETAKKKNKK